MNYPSQHVQYSAVNQTPYPAHSSSEAHSAQAQITQNPSSSEMQPESSPTEPEHSSHKKLRQGGIKNLYRRQAQEQQQEPQELRQSTNQFNMKEKQYSGLPASHQNQIPQRANLQSGGTHYAAGGVPGSSAPNPYAQPREAQPVQRKPPQENKINPRQVPRPRISLEDFKSTKYHYQTWTNEPMMDRPPPQSTSVFRVVDYGNTTPRCLRMTTNRIAMDASLLKQSSIPLGAVLSPLNEPHQGQEQVSVTNYGEEGPFRCPRCHAYINAFFKFIQGGRKTICPFCQFTSDVPVNYVSSIDELGVRRDRFDRYELCKGTYEFIAPSSYSNAAPVTPRIVFPELLSIVVGSIKSSLDYIQCPERTEVVVLSFNTSIQFYAAHPNKPESDPTLIQMGDLEQPFIPCPCSQLALNLHNNKDQINALLDRVVSYAYSDDTGIKVGSCGGAAIRAGCELLNSYKNPGGKVIAFLTHVPSLGWGAITNRVDFKLFNTQKQRTLLDSGNIAYERLAKECKDRRVAVDLLITPPVQHNYTPQFDLASMSLLPNITGGSLYFYKSFNPTTQSQLLYYDIYRNLTRNQALEPVIRARTTTGLSVVGLNGSFYTRQAPDVQLSVIDEDKTIGVMLKQDGKIKDRDLVGLQIAMLYTTLEGERRIRVWNKMFRVQTQIAPIFKNCDGDAIMAYQMRDMLSRMIVTSVKKVREDLVQQVINILFTYRYECANNNQPSQLVLPQNFKRNLLYVNCALKNPAFKLLGSCNIDQKIACIHKLCSISPNALMRYLFPLVIEVSLVAESKFEYESQEENPEAKVQFMKSAHFSVTPVSLKYITDQGAFIINNGKQLILFVGQQVPVSFLRSIFAVDNYEDLRSMDKISEFPPAENQSQLVIQHLLERQREAHEGGFLPFKLLLSGEQETTDLLKELPVQDMRSQDEFPYVDFLCHIHKLVRNKVA